MTLSIVEISFEFERRVFKTLFLFFTSEIMNKEKLKIPIVSNPLSIFFSKVFSGNILIIDFMAFSFIVLLILGLSIIVDSLLKKRLFKNMKILNMGIDETIDQLVDITAKLVKVNNHKEDVYIRPIVYFSDLAIGPKLIGYTAKIAIYTLPLGDYIDTDKGIKAKVSSWTRLNDNMIPPRLKVTGAYVNSAMAKTEALLAGAEEAIVLNKDGYVSEGSAENIFIVRNGKLITPPVSDDILEGITRNAVMEIARDLNIPVVERSISRTELYVADEVFFCGTGAQISPVIEIDGKPVPAKILRL